MGSQKKLLPTLVGIVIVVLLSTFFYYKDDTSNTLDYLTIIQNIFRNSGQNIHGAVALWGKGDVLLDKQLHSNYPLDNISVRFVSKNDERSEKYYLIMEVIKEIPELEKTEVKGFYMGNYHIIGANIQWNYVFCKYQLISCHIWSQKLLLKMARASLILELATPSYSVRVPYQNGL